MNFGIRGRFWLSSWEIVAEKQVRVRETRFLAFGRWYNQSSPMDKKRLLLYCWLFLILLAALACQPLPVALTHPAPSPTSAQPLASPTFPALTPFALSPTPSPTPAVSFLPAACPEPRGRLERGVIAAPGLDKPMRYAVYLPPCVQTISALPVLYLLHGQNYDEDQWIRLGAIETAERLRSAGEIPPFIIVFPYDYSYKQPTEYPFAQVFLRMLLPRIERDYSACSQAACRAIGGLSRGGAWAIHLGLRNPQVFGAVGAHSPAVFYSDMTTLRLRLSQADPATFPRVFIDVGRYDSQYQTARAFAGLLDEMNLPHEWHEYIGFHEEKYWATHLEEYLRWYAAAWR